MFIGQILVVIVTASELREVVTSLTSPSEGARLLPVLCGRETLGAWGITGEAVMPGDALTSGVAISGSPIGPQTYIHFAFLCAML